MAMKTHETSVSFAAAKAVWPKGMETEKNLFVGFRAAFETPAGKRTVLRVAASSLYRAWLNGEFLAHGPARGPRGFFRMDEWDITARLRPGRNILAIEVAGYNVNGYYLLDQPAFLQAEVAADGKALVATGRRGADFDATIIRERVRKVARYSFQRPFTEVYRLRAGSDKWRNSTAKLETVPCEATEKKVLIPRRVPLPDFATRPATWHVAGGSLAPGQKIEKLATSRFFKEIGPTLGGFPEADLEVNPYYEWQAIASIHTTHPNAPLAADARLRLGQNSFHIMDLGTNLTGFLGATVTCRKKTRFFMLFDEILREGDIDFKRLECVNIVSYELDPGTHRLESFEPYTLRYLKLAVLEGDAEVSGVHLRELANPNVWQAHFAASDQRLDRIFEAGRETYRQNALDIFMDCPSRERAGWLCDSFFTSRAGLMLNGDTSVEHAFYENYLLPPKFKALPEGMLPMCYPSDHYNGTFIPNWALWFVVQLEEYLSRSGDRRTVNALKPKVLKLFDYFKPFRNSDGLLEKLQSWVFIEWSQAARYVQDVSYPTNALYAGALSAAARMYKLPKLAQQANAIRETIRAQSFDGTFFVDNAVRKDGKLEVTRNRTEACQYYQFYFEVATPSSHSVLWQTLCEKFGPQRKQTNEFPEIAFANSFIGNMLRFELLSLYGRCQQILDESMGYLLFMADKTGTLWEHDRDSASCNHGFASHICHTLYRDILGVYRLDPVNKRLRLRLSDLKIDWCEGRIPVPGGAVAVSWRKECQRIVFTVDTPAGWQVDVENPSGNELVRLA
jgi:alpha-L-rhamnosidase